MNINIGDHVWRKEGGLEMTVISTDDTTSACSWKDINGVHADTFNNVDLTHQNPKPVISGKYESPNSY